MDAKSTAVMKDGKVDTRSGKVGQKGVAYADRMRWEPFDIPNSRGRAWIKTLSKNEENGARTCLVRWDPGFHQDKAVTTAPIDTFVIDGEAEVGDQKWQTGTFSYRPMGASYGPIDCPNGMTRLVFRAPTTFPHSKEPTFIQDTRLMPWTPNYDDPDGTGKTRGVREMRTDKEGNYKIVTICHFKVGWRAIPDAGHIHDCIEEAYLVSGKMADYLGECDGHIEWVPGFYVCREPYVSPHGDVIVLEAPVLMIARREWTGAERDLRSSDWKRFQLKPTVDYAE